MKKINKPLKKLKKKAEIVDNLETDTEDGDEKEKADRFEEHGCEFLNEAECEEELDDDGLEVEEIEREHFEEEKE